MGDGSEPARKAQGSVPDLFARLIADARAWGRAELALLRTRGEALAAGLKTSVVLLGVAVVLASAALVAMAVGLVLMLATLVGPALATLIVVATLLVLAGLAGWLGWSRIARTFEDQE